MVQILGYSGNSTDRPHASTVGIRSVVGPIAGSGTLEAVPAQPVEPVRVRLASQELSGDFPIRSSAGSSPAAGDGSRMWPRSGFVTETGGEIVVN